MHVPRGARLPCPPPVSGASRVGCRGCSRRKPPGCRSWGVECRAWGVGHGVQGVGCGVQGVGCGQGGSALGGAPSADSELRRRRPPCVWPCVGRVAWPAGPLPARAAMPLSVLRAEPGRLGPLTTSGPAAGAMTLCDSSEAPRAPVCRVFWGLLTCNLGSSRPSVPGVASGLGHPACQGTPPLPGQMAGHLRARRPAHVSRVSPLLQVIP